MQAGTAAVHPQKINNNKNDGGAIANRGRRGSPGAIEGCVPVVLDLFALLCQPDPGLIRAVSMFCGVLQAGLTYGNVPDSKNGAGGKRGEGKNEGKA